MWAAFKYQGLYNGCNNTTLKTSERNISYALFTITKAISSQSFLWTTFPTQEVLNKWEHGCILTWQLSIPAWIQSGGNETSRPIASLTDCICGDTGSYNIMLASTSNTSSRSAMEGQAWCFCAFYTFSFLWRALPVRNNIISFSLPCSFHPSVVNTTKYFNTWHSGILHQLLNNLWEHMYNSYAERWII